MANIDPQPSCADNLLVALVRPDLPAVVALAGVVVGGLALPVPAAGSAGLGEGRPMRR